MNSNSFYNHGNTPPFGSAITSSGLSQEFDKISNAFNLLPVIPGNNSKILRVNSSGTAVEAITLTPSIIGAAASGVNTDITSLNAPALGAATATTAAAGTSTTQIATTAFVSATSFASVLPGQTGNAGKFITTNGTNASWAYPQLTALSSITSSASLSTMGIASVAMSSAYQAISLPNATTMNAGGALYVLKNTGSYTFAVNDNSGTLLGVIAPRNTVTIFLLDNSTSAGIWWIANNSEFGILTSGFSYSTSIIEAAIDTGYFSSLAQLTSTTYAFAYRANSAPVKIAILSVSGISVSVSNPVTVDSNGAGGIGIAVLSPTSVVITYTNATNAYPMATVVTISGTTATPGTPTALQAIAYSATSGARVTALSSTSGVAIFMNSTNYPTAFAFTVSGTTITAGTAAVIVSVAPSNIYTTAITSISATQALAFYTNGSGNATGVVLSVSGTTITANTPVTTNTQNNYSISIGILSSSSFIISSSTATNLLVSYITISGTAITVNNTITADSSVDLGGGSVSTIPITSTSAQIFYSKSGLVYGVNVSISGSSVQLSNTIPVGQIGISAGGSFNVSCAVSGNNILVTSQNSTGYHTANIGAIIK